MQSKQLLLIVLAFFVAAFGQPASIPFLGVLAGAIGYGFFFIAISECSSRLRFVSGTFFFAAVQLVQLSWLISHPYSYIWGVYFLLALLMGAQFGCLCLLATRERLARFSQIFLMSSLWTLTEWSRLFFLSGFTFNPVGLALASSTIGLQAASIAGVYGLSFWTIMTNALAARASIVQNFCGIRAVSCAALLPYLFGVITLAYHGQQQKTYDAAHPPLKALIVNSKTLPEELMPGNLVGKAFSTWEQIVDVLVPYKEQKFDLILFPECVVPFPGEAAIFPLSQVETLLMKIVPLHESLTLLVAYTEDHQPYVSSYSIAQALSNALNTPFVIGLEGSDYSEKQKRDLFFNSAYFIEPNKTHFQRYDKSILLPMAESIPYEWAKPLAAFYGLYDSFQPGRGAQIFEIGNQRIGASICYEDIFNTITHENRTLGATVLVNLTNDGWYPNSSLGIQHLEHARLRAVENGVPLLRACNFGVSGAIDSCGRTIQLVPFQLLKKDIEAFSVEVSTYTYPTLFILTGNFFIIIACLCVVAYGLYRSMLRR